MEFNAIVTLLGQGVSADALVGILARRYGLPEAQRRMRGYLDQLAARADRRGGGDRPVSRLAPAAS